MNQRQALQVLKNKAKVKGSKGVKRRAKGTPESPLRVVTLMLWRRLQEGGFILLMALSICLFVSLITYNELDPGWSHTGAGAVGLHKANLHNNLHNAATLHNATGRAGAWFSDLFLYLFGYIAYMFPAILAYAGIRLFQRRYELGHFHRLLWVLRFFGFVTAIGAGCGLFSMHLSGLDEGMPMSAGGILGKLIVLKMIPAFGQLGTTLLFFSFFLAGITLTTGLSWFGVMDKAGQFMLTRLEKFALKDRLRKLKEKGFLGVIQLIFKSFLKLFAKRDQIISIPVGAGSSRITPLLGQDERRPLKEDIKKENKKENNIKVIIKDKNEDKDKNKDRDKDKDKKEISKDHNFKIKNREWPDFTLLEEPSEKEQKEHQASFSAIKLENLSREVEARLLEFGVEAKVVEVLPGPVITRFEMELAAGIKVSKVSGLSKDLARALSVTKVRVVEVIPGKSVIGLEIPNDTREVVRLREILESTAYQESSSPLSLALGKDISGIPIVVNLAKMPHLLVAGTTGSGKSVGVNAMLLSLLYKASPLEVRLILIDPKMLELSIYDGIPHLLTPVVTDMKDAANALKWCVAEMERRYQIMAAVGVRNLVGFNRKIEEAEAAGKPIFDPLYEPELGMRGNRGSRDRSRDSYSNDNDDNNDSHDSNERPVLTRLPYIVVIIDEFADMMMVVGKKVEELIARIAQKARAAGINMILATQRPSVDVITGLIKANVPTRIAYQVSSRIDSRTILDQQGAEQLLGHGDMLYLAPGTGIPIRIHGAFVSDEEVHSVVKALKQSGEPDYAEDILSSSASNFSGMGFGLEDEEDGEQDELYDEAVRIVTESRKSSISYLQRRLKIGYNRAARLIETMELSGVLSPVQSNGSREVLAPAPV